MVNSLVLVDRAGTAVVKSAMRYLRTKLLGLRAWMNPEVRDLLDGMGAVFAITLFFCLIQATHDGIVNRNRAFDEQRWWYPIYRILN